MTKLRLRKLVDTEEAMNKFIVDYRIPPNISLRHCKMGEWHYERETSGGNSRPRLCREGYENPYGASEEGLPQALLFSPHLVRR